MANWPPRTQEDLDAMAASQALQPVVPASANPISAMLQDVLGSLAESTAEGSPLSAMVWRGKKRIPVSMWAALRGIPQGAVGKTFKPPEKIDDPEQFVKFLKRMQENLPVRGAKELPVTGGSNERLTQDFLNNLELGRAYWKTRREPTAKRVSNINLGVEIPGEYYGTYKESDPTRYKGLNIREQYNEKPALNIGPYKVYTPEQEKEINNRIRYLLADEKEKAGTINIDPSLHDKDLVELLDTLTHEGRHAIQSRKMGHQNLSNLEWKEKMIAAMQNKDYKEWVEPQAYKAGELGKNDFVRFMDTLLQRVEDKEPLLMKAINDDPGLMTLIESLERQGKSGIRRYLKQDSQIQGRK